MIIVIFVDVLLETHVEAHRRSEKGKRLISNLWVPHAQFFANVYLSLFNSWSQSPGERKAKTLFPFISSRRLHRHFRLQKHYRIVF
jgi:hypothetical protein